MSHTQQKIKLQTKKKNKNKTLLQVYKCVFENPDDFFVTAVTLHTPVTSHLCALRQMLASAGVIFSFSRHYILRCQNILTITIKMHIQRLHHFADKMACFCLSVCLEQTQITCKLQHDMKHDPQKFNWLFIISHFIG